MLADDAGVSSAEAARRLLPGAESGQRGPAPSGRGSSVAGINRKEKRRRGEGGGGKWWIRGERNCGQRIPRQDEAEVYSRHEARSRAGSVGGGGVAELGREKATGEPRGRPGRSLLPALQDPTGGNQGKEGEARIGDTEN